MQFGSLSMNERAVLNFRRGSSERNVPYERKHALRRIFERGASISGTGSDCSNLKFWKGGPHHDTMVNDPTHFQVYVSFEKDVRSRSFTNEPFIIDPTEVQWSNAPS
jgi:hypothetical protein